MTSRYGLRDDQWERIEHLLPGRSNTVGVTAKDVRTMVMRRNAIARGRTRGVTPRGKKAIVTLQDGDTLAALQAGWGHQDLGVYAVVTHPGTITLGDEVIVP